MRAEKVIFVITTDGLENASHRYRAAQIKEMIDICTGNLKEDLYKAFGCDESTNGEPQVQ